MYRQPHGRDLHRQREVLVSASFGSCSRRIAKNRDAKRRVSQGRQGRPLWDRRAAHGDHERQRSDQRGPRDRAGGDSTSVSALSSTAIDRRRDRVRRVARRTRRGASSCCDRDAGRRRRRSIAFSSSRRRRASAPSGVVQPAPQTPPVETPPPADRRPSTPRPKVPSTKPKAPPPQKVATADAAAEGSPRRRSLRRPSPRPVAARRAGRAPTSPTSTRPGSSFHIRGTRRTSCSLILRQFRAIERAIHRRSAVRDPARRNGRSEQHQVCDLVGELSV